LATIDDDWRRSHDRAQPPAGVIHVGSAAGALLVGNGW